MRDARRLLAALGLVAALAPVATAQDDDAVPGGWSIRYRHQSLGAARVAPPLGPAVAPPVAIRPAPGVVPSRARRQAGNQLGFLGSTVRRTTRPRRAR